MPHPQVIDKYNELRVKGYGEKFDRPGIYCITVDRQIAYIGKSTSMLWRIAEHEVERNWRREEKYCILHELKWYGYTIDYDVLYTAKSGTPDALEEEIGKMEGKYIRAYLPPLNTQIPLEEDWRRYKTKEIDAGQLYEMLGCYYG